MAVFTVSVINVEVDNVCLDKTQLPIGALHETNDVIDPTVLIQPGTATGDAAEGIPSDNPPRPDVNPYGPA